MPVASAQPNACKRQGASALPSRTPPQSCEIPADFSKVDSILRHLQQTESHDWIGEITHCCAQVGYLLLQNYNISRFNFYNYNFHLIVLTALFFAQRIWVSMWRVTQFSDAHGLRFACHIVLFMVLLDSLYCGMQLVLKDAFAGSLYLATPLLSSVLFHLVYLKSNTNVFTAELFSMLSRCVYHSLETAYCIGVLPLKFLQYEYIYFDATRCMILTGFVTVHSFLSLFCLELHCLGSEVLQQTRMLGEWRCIPDLTRLKTISPKPAEWTHHNCPYPRGALVRSKGQYYEAMAALNTCAPTSPSQCIHPIAFVLGDSQRTKALVLLCLFILTAALVPLILCSNQWSMYAVMLIPNCGHFLYVKYRRSHAFFNPAHMNLRQLQWDLNVDSPQYKINGAGHPRSGLLGGGWSSFGEDGAEEDGDNNHREDVMADGHGLNHGGDGFPQAGAGFPYLRYPNPLFLSAVSASTMFFFGPSGSVRPPSDHASSAPSQHERGSGRE
mmetsp:Transcript_1141/g.2827  ORF Transcript_1141/g.2827 Transcript_1141/m.2827 type:complete len:498 (+) Transcript_1141:51-1544(+)